MANFDEKRRNFSLYPLLWLASAFASGILAANFIRLSAFFWFAVALILGAFICLSLFRRKRAQTTIPLLLALATSGAMLFEVEKQNAAVPHRLQNIYDRGEIDFQTTLEIIGVLQNEPEQAVGGAFLTLRVEKINFRQIEQYASGAIRLFVPLQSTEATQIYERLELRYGARIKVLTAVTREDRFRNPGYTPFREILDRQRLDGGATLKSARQIERLDDTTVFLPLALLYDWRESLIRQFRANFSSATAGVLIASLLGNRHFLSNETAEKFRVGGTFHILVISGFQITLIGAFAAWLIRRFTKSALAQFLIANAILWFYALMVGADAPVTRAALMFTVFHAAFLFGRQPTSVNSLGASALILLVLRPSDLFDQSFQLTFVSVAALVAFAFPLVEKMRQIGAWSPSQETPAPPACSKWLKTLCETLFWSENRWQIEQKRNVWKCRLFKSNLAIKLENWNLQTVWQFVFCSILVSAVVQICLLPLMAIYFHRISIIALVLNFFVGALMAVESLAAIAGLLVSAINATLAQPLVWLCEALNWLMIESVEPFAFFSPVSFRLPIYSGWMRAIYFVYFLPLVLLAIRLNRWNPFESKTQSPKSKVNSFQTGFGLWTLGFGQLALSALIIIHPFSEARGDGRLRIDFLDVGQGDSALITLPDATTVLVDGGGKPRPAAQIEYEDGEIEQFEPDARSVGETVVSEFLWENGLNRVDFLMPSHADADHIDGLNDAAQNFQIESALVASAPENKAEFVKFRKTLESRAIPLLKIRRGDRLEIGGATIEVLHPSLDADLNAASGNNHSIVFRLTYGSRSFLFTGDIEAQAENELLGQSKISSCDVVKVAHHGSKTSSSENFVRYTNARFAVISVGRESPYGHPHKQVVERWRQAGARVLTTGENGTISFSTDGEDLLIKTFVR